MSEGPKRLDVVWTAREIDEDEVAKGAVLVIDVLRATTMMIRLLEAGASEIFPVTEVEEARELALRLGPGTLLAGEREGLPPDGFDMGNSPSAVDPALVKGKRVVLTTTNGTRAISRSAKAPHLALAAFVNAHAIVEWVEKTRADQLTIVCAGTKDRFSLDDALCAGLIVDRLRAGGGWSATDSAVAAGALFERYRGELVSAVEGCTHGKILTALGFSTDIRLATAVDSTAIVPVRSGQSPTRVIGAA